MTVIRALANRISLRNRTRKLSLFENLVAPRSSDLVLDVGFTNKELRESDNYLERHYERPERVVALGVDYADRFASRYPLVRIVRYGGGGFPFVDGSFDVCWSNAVVEHVGGRDSQVHFFREIARVARKAFVTTPNRRFPIELHTLVPLVHWLPKRLCDAVLALVGKGWATGDYMRLLTARELKSVLHEAGIRDYRLVRNRLGGITLDFVVVFECGRQAHTEEGGPR